jgi:hypothetical protein
LTVSLGTATGRLKCSCVEGENADQTDHRALPVHIGQASMPNVAVRHEIDVSLPPEGPSQVSEVFFLRYFVEDILLHKEIKSAY